MAKKSSSKKRSTKTTIKKKPTKSSVSIKIDDVGGIVEKAKCKNVSKSCGCGGFAYFLAALGAAVYYISTATGFWMGVWGVVKALFWPAFIVFEIMKFMGL